MGEVLGEEKEKRKKERILLFLMGSGEVMNAWGRKEKVESVFTKR